MLEVIFGSRHVKKEPRTRLALSISRPQILEYLGCAASEVYFRRGWSDNDDDADIDGFDKWLEKECEIVLATGRSRATFRLPARGKDKDATYIDAVLLVTYKGTKLVVSEGPIDPLYYGETTMVFDIMAAEKDKALVDKLFRAFFSDRRLRGGILMDASFGSHRVRGLGAQISLDDVILPAQTRKIIEDNTLGLLEKRATYRKNGIPLKRGLLFVGPPGNGKTMVCRALAKTGKFTTIWVPPGENRDLASDFAKAAKLAPSIVLLEDLDLVVGPRDGSKNSKLGELLNLMDGLIEAGGVITIATTNFPELLDKALAGRPNRFDIRIPFDNPDQERRLQMLQRFTEPQTKLPGLSLEEWAARTDGLSGAQMRELCRQAIKHAIEADRVDNAGLAQLDASDMESGLQSVLSLWPKDKAFGFQLDSPPAADER